MLELLLLCPSCMSKQCSESDAQHACETIPIHKRLKVRKFVCSCTRPPLEACTEEEFEEDLYAFLGRRGEEQLALKLRNKQITWYTPLVHSSRVLPRVVLGWSFFWPCGLIRLPVRLPAQAG